MVPYGMSGREAGNLTNTVEGSSPYVVGGAADDKQGTGTVIYEGQYPFDVTNGMLIKREMTSLMGLSGYQEEEYWTTTDIWQMMYRALAE